MNTKLKAKLRRNAPSFVFWGSMIVMVWGSAACLAFEARNPLVGSYGFIRHLAQALLFQRLPEYQTPSDDVEEAVRRNRQ